MRVYEKMPKLGHCEHLTTAGEQRKVVVQRASVANELVKANELLSVEAIGGSSWTLTKVGFLKIKIYNQDSKKPKSSLH